MRIQIYFIVILCAVMSFTAGNAQSSGLLDFNFGQEGWSNVDQGTLESNLAIDLQPDGKIVAAGYVEERGDSRLTVLRYQPNGTLDSSFAQNGQFSIEIYKGINSAQALRIQPDGKILVAGYTTDTLVNAFLKEDIVLLRLLSNGTLDTGFGNMGLVNINQTLNERPVGIDLTTDGKIVLVANSNNYNNSKILVFRFQNNGSPDNTFGSNGQVNFQFVSGKWNFCNDMKLLPDGRILVVGEAQSLSDPGSMAIARLNANGALDNTFDGDGKVIYHLSTLQDVATALLVLPDGKMVVGGYANGTGLLPQFALLKLQSDGAKDLEFGTEGALIQPFGVQFSTVNALCLSSAGDIIAAGGVNQTATLHNFLLARFDLQGNLVQSFGQQGVTESDFDTHFDGVTDAAVLSNGKILVAGMGVKMSNSISDKLLAQYLFDGNVPTATPEQSANLPWISPNPVKDYHTALHFTLEKASGVNITLLDAQGRLIQAFEEERLPAGTHRSVLELPKSVPPGGYFLQVKTADAQHLLRMMVL